MKLAEFTSALSQALVERGVPADVARTQISRMAIALSEDDLRMIDACNSKKELDGIADELSAAILRRTRTKKPEAERGVAEKDEDYFSEYEADSLPQDEETVMESEEIANEDVEQDDSVNEDSYSAPVEYSFPADDLNDYAPDSATLAELGIDGSFEAEAIEMRDKNGRELDEDGLPVLPQIRESAAKRREFRKKAALFSPLIALGAVIHFGFWGVAIAAECALIAVFVAALIAVAAGGTLASITGIIYGIVKLSSQRGEGLFEIGLGIVVAGATLLLCVLIYNLALRFLPWAIRKSAYFCRLTTRLIRIKIRNYRGGLTK